MSVKVYRIIPSPMNSVFIPTSKPVSQSLIQTVRITKKGVYVEASSGFGQSSDSIRCHHGIVSAEIGQLSTIPPKQRTKEAVEAYKERKKDYPSRLSWADSYLKSNVLFLD